MKNRFLSLISWLYYLPFCKGSDMRGGICCVCTRSISGQFFRTLTQRGGIATSIYGLGVGNHGVYIRHDFQLPIQPHISFKIT